MYLCGWVYVYVCIYVYGERERVSDQYPFRDVRDVLARKVMTNLSSIKLSQHPFRGETRCKQLLPVVTNRLKTFSCGITFYY